MIKTFTWTRPDEPYKTAATGTRTIEVTYKGPRYLLVEVDPREGTGSLVRAAEDPADPELSTEQFRNNQWTYVLVDADESPALASALTLNYTHPDPNDWSETVTDADGETSTWEHNYDETTGLIEHETVGVNGGFTYNSSTGQWQGPEYRTHMVERQDALDGWARQAQDLATVLSEAEGRGLTQDQIDDITAYKEFLESIPTKYADVDHWKIPFTLDWPDF